MQKFINLEETPFVDLRANKNVNHFTIESNNPFRNLPQDEDKIEYKIYKDFVKYDYQKYTLTDKGDEKIFDETIKALKEELRLAIDIRSSKKFKELALKHITTIVKYLNQDDPRAAWIALRASCHNMRYSVPIDKLK